MVPAIADQAPQLLSMAVVTGPSVVLCARFLPRLVYLANMVDMTTNVGFLVILFLAALHAEVLDEKRIGHLFTVVLVFNFMTFSLVFLMVVYKAIPHRGKKIPIFLCHHKQGGGGFTRLLKWRLKRDDRVRRGVFLDADNLVDLDLLFGYVGDETDTLVVICSSEILARPWCVGEMTTARLHDVDTILVVLPCFTWPTDDFFTRYATHVPGILGISKFGISVEMARVTLSWLQSQSRLSLPHKVSLSVSEVVARKLVSHKRGLCEYSMQFGVESRSLNVVQADRSLSRTLRRKFTRNDPAEHVVAQLEDQGAMLTSKAVAIVDRRNWEGICAALLVREMLVSHLSAAPEKVHHVLTEDDGLPPDTDSALILCTNGCFHSVHFAHQVLAAAATGVHLIPIVAEENFHFPTDAFHEDVRRRAPSILQSQKLLLTNMGMYC